VGRGWISATGRRRLFSTSFWAGFRKGQSPSHVLCSLSLPMPPTLLPTLSPSPSIPPCLPSLPISHPPYPPLHPPPPPSSSTPLASLLLFFPSSVIIPHLCPSSCLFLPFLHLLSPILSCARPVSTFFPSFLPPLFYPLFPSVLLSYLSPHSPLPLPFLTPFILPLTLPLASTSSPSSLRSSLTPSPLVNFYLTSPSQYTSSFSTPRFSALHTAPPRPVPPSRPLLLYLILTAPQPVVYFLLLSMLYHRFTSTYLLLSSFSSGFFPSLRPPLLPGPLPSLNPSPLFTLTCVSLIPPCVFCTCGKAAARRSSGPIV